MTGVSKKITGYRTLNDTSFLPPSFPFTSFLSVFPSFLSVLIRFHDVAGPESTTYACLLNAGTTGERQSWAKSANLPLVSGSVFLPYRSCFIFSGFLTLYSLF